MNDSDTLAARPRLNLLVLRSQDASKLAEFYSKLGLVFARHRHGSGPEHFGTDLGGSLLEIYPQKSPESATATVRLGFAVADVDKSYDALIAGGGTGLSKPTLSEWGRRAVVRDLDGNKLELTEAMA